MEFVSRKVNDLPPYLFSKIQEKKEALQAKGMDVIDLGIGAPDLPTPTFIIDKLIREMKIPANHRYSSYSGCREFREAVVHFYKQRYGVTLHPDEEVLTLIGSKEGIANLVQTVINPGDYVLVPTLVIRYTVHCSFSKWYYSRSSLGCRKWLCAYLF
ncbi:aminotransferase class I/II-fold pyridoxal phosphate-dependent enzyme [Paracerasibacillus soli]|uniref:Aminotransferase class I/II-fold pyridoxal phosphate-dependent enzyme n=1 Tax=Paracerasibacillus soli TaxID=480284 RepID=A0ABU5CMF1_9BACI|nr:aminotransferase class I/II-fold pyridoxal phosphate-dependent enzyme [Virgibacillus soli]MDY0407520.1 aminotransferase class I/II-fold pyridoxal phosphate-dependent enzyme [Virgibacillus soli]